MSTNTKKDVNTKKRKAVVNDAKPTKRAKIQQITQDDCKETLELLAPQLGLSTGIELSKKQHILPRTGIEKLVQRVCKNDTSQISWWEKGSDFKDPTKEIERVTPFFCDNFLLFTVFDSSRVEKAKNGQSNVFRDCGVFNKQIHNALREAGLTEERFRVDGRHLGKIDKKDYDNLKYREAVRAYRERYPDRPQGEYYKQAYKVSCSNVELNQILDFLENHLDRLRKEYLVFFQDLDITGDYACCPTDRIIQHIEALGVKIVDNKARAEYLAAYWAGKTTEEDCIYFVQNEDVVGENCWTFLICRDNICMRIKIYNKFVCQLESPGVTETFGSHLLNMVFQGKDPQLLRTFHDERVQKCGVSRIECTFYGKVPKREKLPSYFAEMEELFLPACNATPIVEQWQALGRQLQETAFFYDCQSGMFVHVAWFNKGTGKINGGCAYTKKQQMQLNHHRTAGKRFSVKQIRQAMERLSFHGLPIRLWLLDYQIFHKKEKDQSEELLHDYNGFNFQQCSYGHVVAAVQTGVKKGLPAEDKSRGPLLLRRNWRVTSNTYIRSGTYKDTLLVKNCDVNHCPEVPRKNGMDQEEVSALFQKAGLIDLEHFRPRINTDRKDGRKVDSQLKPQGERDQLEQLEQTTATEKGKEEEDRAKARIKKRKQREQNRKQEQKIEQQSDHGIEDTEEQERKAFLESSKLKLKNPNALEIGRYKVLATRRYTHWKKDKLVLLMRLDLGTCSERIYAQEQLEELLSRCQANPTCPFYIEKVGHKFGEGRARYSVFSLEQTGAPKRLEAKDFPGRLQNMLLLDLDKVVTVTSWGTQTHYNKERVVFKTAEEKHTYLATSDFEKIIRNADSVVRFKRVGKATYCKGSNQYEYATIQLV